MIHDISPLELYPAQLHISLDYPEGNKYSAYTSNRSYLIDRLIKIVKDYLAPNLEMYEDEFPSRSEFGLDRIPEEVFEDYDKKVGKELINKLENEVKSEDPDIKIWIEIIHSDLTNLTN